MKGIVIKCHERFLAGIGLMALAGSLAWSWRAQLDISRVRGGESRIQAIDSDYEPAVYVAALPDNSPWNAPSDQSAGRGWRYELFTPPAVFYHPQSVSFTVASSPDSADAEAPFEIELVALKRELFRVQLAGYYGSKDAYTVVLSQPGRAGVLFGRIGTRFDELGLVLKDFSISRVGLEHRDSEPIAEPAALAELWDEQSGEIVTLDSRKPKFLDVEVATVCLSFRNKAHCEVRAGDVLASEDSTYRIEQISLDPFEVVVSRERHGAGRTETRTLRISEHPLNRPSVAVAPLPSTHSRLATGFPTPDP